MFLNTVKTDGGYSNELTQILSFFTGKRIVMQADHKMNVAYTTESVGTVEIGITGKVSAVKLNPEYEEYLQDISFLFRAKHLKHGEAVDYDNASKHYDKISGFLVMSEDEYVAMATSGKLNSLLSLNTAHGVVIPQKSKTSVTYDYGSQSGFYEGTVLISDGVIRLIPTNTKPVTRYVKKFTVMNSYLCVYDLAYVENVGCIFATVNNTDVCTELLNVTEKVEKPTKSEKSSKANASILSSLNIFGG